MANAIASLLILTRRWDRLKQKFVSSRDMDTIFESLDSSMRWLVFLSDTYIQLFEKNYSKMMPSHAYTDWITRVNVVLKQVNELNIMYTMERKRSSFFSINSRSRFTNLMMETTSQVLALSKGDGTVFKPLSILVSTSEVFWLERAFCFRTPSIQDFPTLRQPFLDTLGWLSDKNVFGIRIHGFFGSGKTTIMKNLNNHVMAAGMFDIVIWVSTYGGGGTMENKGGGIHLIQHEIAQRLKLSLHVPAQLLASRIREILEDVKFLLLLDDVNQDLNLDHIGIPYNNIDKGSKVVFTTSLQHVCSSIATRQANVTTLDREEATQMFLLQLIDSSQHYDKGLLMPLIVDWCGRNPLVINVVSNVFSRKISLPRWGYALKLLRKRPEKVNSLIMQLIYKLKRCCDWYDQVTQNEGSWCYTALNMDIQKDCFLDYWQDYKECTDDDNVEKLLVPDIWKYLKIFKLPVENTS